MERIYPSSEDFERRRLEVMNEMLIVLKKYVSQHDYTNAQFYCDYLLHMLNERDVMRFKIIHLIVEVFYNLKEYWRCVNILEEHVFPPKQFIEHKELFAHSDKPYLFLLYINCLFFLAKYQRANNFLCGDKHDVFCLAIEPARSVSPYQGLTRVVDLHLEFLKLKAKLCLLCGDDKASFYYQQVFYQDPLQMSVFFHILHNDLLTPYELLSLVHTCKGKLTDSVYRLYMAHLPLTSQKHYYDVLVNRYPFFRTSAPVLFTYAYNLYQHHDYEGCVRITKKLVDDLGQCLVGTRPAPHSTVSAASVKDGQYRSSISSSSHLVVLHINAQMKLGKKSDLFFTAHKLLENHPENPVTYYAIASYYTLLNRTEVIINYLRRCLKSHDRFLDGWILLGHTYSNMDKLNDAIRCYRTALIFFPKNPWPPYYLAQSHLRMGNVSLAREFIFKAIKLRRKFKKERKLMKARREQMRSERRERKEIERFEFEQQQQQQQQQMMMGQQEQQQHGRKRRKRIYYDEDDEEYEDDDDDDDEEEEEEEEGEEGGRYNNNFYSPEEEEEDDGRIDSEEVSFERGVDADDDADIPEFVCELGVILYGLESYERSLDCLSRVCRMKKNYQHMHDKFWYTTYYNTANCCRKLKKYPEAICFYKRALRLELNDPQVFVSLGLTYHIIGNLDKAIEQYHNALHIIESSDTHYMPHYFSTFLLRKALVEKSDMDIRDLV